MPYSVIQTLYTQTTRKYLALEKVRVLENAFVNSQFIYAYLIGMLLRKLFISMCGKLTIKHKMLYQSDKSYENLLN